MAVWRVAPPEMRAVGAPMLIRPLIIRTLGERAVGTVGAAAPEGMHGTAT